MPTEYRQVLERQLRHEIDMSQAGGGVSSLQVHAD